MKYLYKILRLFFCPHKYKKSLRQGNYESLDLFTGDRIRTGTFYDKECVYCGKVKRFGKRYK